MPRKKNNWWYSIVFVWKKPTKAEAKRLKVEQKEEMTIDPWAGPFSLEEATDLATWEIAQSHGYVKMATPLYYSGKEPPTLPCNSLIKIE